MNLRIVIESSLCIADMDLFAVFGLSDLNCKSEYTFMYIDIKHKESLTQVFSL